MGDTDIDYGLLHDEADTVIECHWKNLAAAIPVLLASGRMTGDELGGLVGLPNPALPPGTA
ncbi:hypothetical protein [Streptomyces sp. Ac-502]|uniref:hypothetical protein n=1 Tax=Streptomyces sp. Ac-502 TaxID=3342801 RepID=UPI0038626955